MGQDIPNLSPQDIIHRAPAQDGGPLNNLGSWQRAASAEEHIPDGRSQTSGFGKPHGRTLQEMRFRPGSRLRLGLLNSNDGHDGRRPVKVSPTFLADVQDLLQQADQMTEILDRVFPRRGDQVFEVESFIFHGGIG